MHANLMQLQGVREWIRFPLPAFAATQGNITLVGLGPSTPINRQAL